MFRNRKLINKVMYGLAIIIIVSMIILTLGPGILQGNS